MSTKFDFLPYRISLLYWLKYTFNVTCYFTCLKILVHLSLLQQNSHIFVFNKTKPLLLIHPHLPSSMIYLQINKSNQRAGGLYLSNRAKEGDFASLL